MKETTFIKQKIKQWKRFEDLNKQKNADPDEVSQLFIEITDDLSYSKTFYEKRSVRVYLNYIAQQVFLKINKSRKFKPSLLLTFWTKSLPLEIARSWKPLLLAFFIFFSAFLVGVVSSLFDLDFPSLILGEGYIEMTRENIANGDPMAVYHKTGGPIGSTLGITLNNTRIAALTFVSGFFFGLYTLIIMIHNGIMLGAFQTFVINEGVGFEASMVIWIHGVIEISAIIIAGGAGLTVASGLLFPKTYTRLQSLKLSAKRGLKIAMGTIGLLVVSGFIEGMVTRHTQMPMALKTVIIGFSILFILGYYVVYPMIIYRKKIKQGNFTFEDKVPHIEPEAFEPYKIREVGDLFHDTVNLFRKSFGRSALGVFFTSLPFSILCLVYLFVYKRVTDLELYDINLMEYVFFPSNRDPIVFVLNVLMGLGLFHSIYFGLQSYLNKEDFTVKLFLSSWIKNSYKIWPIVIFYGAAFLVQHESFYFFFVLLFPLLIHSLFAGFYKEKDNITLKKVFKNLPKLYFGSILFTAALLAIPFVLMVANSLIGGGTDFVMVDFLFGFIKENINPLLDNPNPVYNIINFIIIYLAIFVLVGLVCAGMLLEYTSVVEKLKGIKLYERLKSFGNKNNIFEQVGEGEY